MALGARTVYAARRSVPLTRKTMPSKSRKMRLLAVLAASLGCLATSTNIAAADTMNYVGAPLIPVTSLPNPWSASAQRTDANGTFRCNVPFAVVQATPSGYAIGNCLENTHLRRSEKSGEYEGRYWDGGKIFGNFDGCGWIQTDYSNMAFGSTENLCPGGNDRLPSTFMRANNDGTGPNGGCSWKTNSAGRSRCTTGTTTTVTSDCDLYANYRPWASNQTPTNVIRTLRAGSPVRWRYITKYGFTGAGNVPFVMVRDSNQQTEGNGSWGFIYQSCITNFPGYTTNFYDGY